MHPSCSKRDVPLCNGQKEVSVGWFLDFFCTKFGFFCTFLKTSMLPMCSEVWDLTVAPWVSQGR